MKVISFSGFFEYDTIRSSLDTREGSYMATFSMVQGETTRQHG